MSRRSVVGLGSLQILSLGILGIFYWRNALLVDRHFRSPSNSTSVCARVHNPASPTTASYQDDPSILSEPAGSVYDEPTSAPIIASSTSTALATPTSHPPTPHLPGPCKPSNNDYLLLPPDFSPWTDEDIDVKRREWQSWLSAEFPTRADPVQKGRGIVIFIGTPAHLHFLNTSVAMIRRYGCRLPIEVWSFRREFENQSDRDAVVAMGSEDAPVFYRFAEDEGNYLPMERGEGDGYHIKVAGIVNAGFRHVLALDVDSIPLSNPEFLFDSPQYVENGAIFWPDYWKTHDENPVWRWMGTPCVDEWEQESGMLVIDKKRSWKALNLLWYISRDDSIRTWHRFLLGDKDLFRFSFRATATPVHWVQHWLQPGGFLTPNAEGSPTFCGLAMVQHSPADDSTPLFAHVNFIKHNNKRLFSLSNLPVSVVKRYRPIAEKDLPPGPSVGSRMMWGSSRGAKAGFVTVGDYTCVDLVGGRREGVEREIELYDIGIVNPSFAVDFYWGVIHENALKDHREWEEKQRRIEKEREESERKAGDDDETRRGREREEKQKKEPGKKSTKGREKEMNDIVGKDREEREQKDGETGEERANAKKVADHPPIREAGKLRDEPDNPPETIDETRHEAEEGASLDAHR
ncbi:mannosyltransferase putative-domain-containing protein [Blyttiomyces helicus]|uniref:Mannosyltransferase putative-domain-containing protein n=1 Tax=Blyttiomyces helicus TaxID=388810 RepID=A0A4P9WB18_9FUNG|nr:mannosyltransferase putative-domain-containing protein [Blyttiomyces helicus]|eukprot:RKO89811.1 mannosyltransferase putative-domain-containing protein [Blyttiomyces helicus]